MPTKPKTPAKTKKTTARAPVKAVAKSTAAKSPMTKKPAAKSAAVKPKRAPAKSATKKIATRKTAPKAAPPKKAPVKKVTPKATTIAANDRKTMRGRSVFVVQTTSKGVVIRPAWLSEDKKLTEMPAVFPEVGYALAVIDDLRKQVLEHFSRAAQVGAQAIASQRPTNKE
jgi:hypothetical protein